MNPTVRSIQEQFPLWKQAAQSSLPALDHNQTHILIGCGTSYYLAQSVAAALNEAGFRALAVPGGEWLHRPESYLPAGTRPHVLAFSRSGESTETVQAAIRSRNAGLHVTGLTCESDSSLAKNADTVLYAPTHPEEGIVMTASASLMLLLGLRLAGLDVTAEDIQASEHLLHQAQEQFSAAIAGRSHFVFLGAGSLYGIAQEGALKLQEMSLTYTQAYHPMEYRHGPISLVDERTAAVLLYHPDSAAEESKLAREMSSKGARVIGFGGPGDVNFELQGTAGTRALGVLPALQMLGECVAQAKGLDTLTPRHLTKVVTLA